VKKILLVAVIVLLGACSGSAPEVDPSFAQKYSEFPSLPVSSSQSVELRGAMTFWFWEGEGGCYGTITDGRKIVELHAEADLCRPIEYEEGQEAVVKISYDRELKYGPGDMMVYPVVSFGK